MIVWVADPGPYLGEQHPPPDAEVLLWTFSMSVRFVSSKKEKGEKHQRRSHNAEAESKNEHRVERGVVGIDRLCVVKSPLRLSFERTTSPCCDPRAAGPGNGADSAGRPLYDVQA